MGVVGSLLVHTLETFGVLNGYSKLLFHLVVAPVRREINAIETRERRMKAKMTCCIWSIMI